MHSARLNRAQAYVSYRSNQTFLDEPILHFYGINEKHAFEPFR